MTTDSPFYWLASSALIGFAACWVTAVLQYPLVRWVCRAKLKRPSSGFWFAWGMFPILLGTFLAMFTLAFDWLRSVGWLPNRHTHTQMGLSNISQNSSEGEVFWVVALACSALIVAASVYSYRKYLPAHQLLRGILSGKTVVSQPVSFAVVPRAFPLAFTAGLFFPRFYLTKAAVKLLTEKELAIVQSHEQEHIRKRDPLRLLLLTFWEFWLPGVRHIRRQWQRMIEIECDRASIRSGFAPDQIASTILKFEKAKTAWSPPTMTLAYKAENTGDLRLRIESLFYEPPHAIGQAPILSGCSALCLLLTIHFFEVNHELRAFLRWLNW